MPLDLTEKFRGFKVESDKGEDCQVSARSNKLIKHQQMYAKLSKIAVVVIVINHLWSISARLIPTVRNCRLNLLKINPVTPHSAVYKFYCN